MTVINTNIKSLITQTALSRNARDLQTAMNQLATGKRINSAADDAAGLAITNSMTSQINGMQQGVSNANDGISLAQTAEGALGKIADNLQRMARIIAALDVSNASDVEVIPLKHAIAVDLAPLVTPASTRHHVSWVQCHQSLRAFRLCH